MHGCDSKLRETGRTRAQGIDSPFFFGGGVPKPTGNAPRGGSIEGSPNFVWVISSDLDRFKRARVLGFIRPVVPLAGLPLYYDMLYHTGAGIILMQQ